MTRDEFQAIYANLKPTAEGCLLWCRAQGAKGYCTTHFEGRVTKAHIVSYSIFREGVPWDRVLGNLCGHRNCVNPQHWQEMTTSQAHYNSRKVACFRGHPFPRGIRRCNACRKLDGWR